MMGKIPYPEHIKTAVVIPCYKVSGSLLNIIESIPEKSVDYVIVIDDGCPNKSGESAEKLGKDNIIVIYHQENRGVGAAVISGYRKAIALGCGIIVKIDGDGQMDPAYLNDLIAPLINDTADYVKGNRFNDISIIKSMPKLRLLGNSVLSFVIKFVSGYWNIMDPTNGYTAILDRTLKKIDMNKVSDDYFFEINMLIELNIVNAVVKDIAIPARYNNEASSLDIIKVLISFPPKLIKGFLKRVFLKYFIYDFNMVSVYLLFGIPLFIFSLSLGVWQWIDSFVTGIPKSAGTIMLVALPIIVSFQMILQAINIDINNTPKK